MNLRKTSLQMTLLASLLAAASTAFAQDATPGTPPPPPGESMQRASQSVEQAGAYVTRAVEQAFQGTVTAMEDTVVTARVMAALNQDKIAARSNIQVDTIGGIVRLTGSVPTLETAQHAAEVAQQTRGVRAVKNEITVTALSSSMR